jgi:hypothetical protein
MLFEHNSILSISLHISTLRLLNLHKERSPSCFLPTEKPPDTKGEEGKTKYKALLNYAVGTKTIGKKRMILYVEDNATYSALAHITIEQLTVKNGVFWDVTSCGSCKNRRFGGT